MIAQALARDAVDGALELGVRADELVEDVTRDAQQAHVGRGDHRRESRIAEAAPPVERRQLAEELARPELADALGADADVDGPGENDVEVLRHLPLRDDRLAASASRQLGRLGEPLQLVRRSERKIGRRLEVGDAGVGAREPAAPDVRVALVRLAPSARRRPRRARGTRAPARRAPSVVAWPRMHMRST